MAVTVIAVVVTLLVAALILRNARARSERKAEMHRHEIAQVQAEMPRWQHAMQRWYQLYYCERDDLVFIPGEEGGAPLPQMMQYIYKGTS